MVKIIEDFQEKHPKIFLILYAIYLVLFYACLMGLGYGLALNHASDICNDFIITHYNNDNFFINSAGNYEQKNNIQGLDFNISLKNITDRKGKYGWT